MTAIVFPHPVPAAAQDGAKSTYEIRRRGRFWEVLDSMGELVCMTVYKQGAKEVVRRLPGQDKTQWPSDGGGYWEWQSTTQT